MSQCIWNILISKEIITSSCSWMNLFGENFTHLFIKWSLPVSYRALFNATLQGTAEGILRRRLPPPGALCLSLLLIYWFFSHLSWQTHSSDKSWKKELQLLFRKLWHLGTGAMLHFGVISKKPYVSGQGGCSLYFQKLGRGQNTFWGTLCLYLLGKIRPVFLQSLSLVKIWDLVDLK